VTSLCFNAALTDLELIKKKLPLLEQPGELDRIGIELNRMCIRMCMLMRLTTIISRELLGSK
jgi:hypothetical protein